jgi:hypothetical protein
MTSSLNNKPASQERGRDRGHFCFFEFATQFFRKTGCRTTALINRTEKSLDHKPVHTRTLAASASFTATSAVPKPLALLFSQYLCLCVDGFDVYVFLCV